MYFSISKILANTSFIIVQYFKFVQAQAVNSAGINKIVM